jgi:hypothetical protein
MHRGFVASNAVQLDAKAAGATLGRGNPGPELPRRIVTHVLAVAAPQLGHPVRFVILVKSNDRLLHRAASARSYARAVTAGYA